MNDNFTTTITLIQYLDGELEGPDLNAIQERIATEQDLATELDNLRLTKAAVKSYGLQQTISTVHAEMMKELAAPAKTPVIGMRRILQYTSRIAAVLIIAIGITVLYQYYTATPQQLFKNNYEAFNLRETRGANTGSLLEAPYRNGQPAAVMNMFNEIPNPQPADYFLYANAALSAHNPAAAIQSFLALQEKNKTNDTHFFEEDTDYYLALAYLSNNEPAKALPFFEKIHADKDHPYHHAITGWFMRKLQRLAAAH